MDAQFRVWQAVPASIAASDQLQAAGLLVGLRDGNVTIVLGALHCDQDGLISTKELAEALLPPPLGVVGAYGAPGAPHLRSQTQPGDLVVARGQDGQLQYSLQQGAALADCRPEVVAESADGLPRALTDGHVPVRAVADLVLAVSSSSGPGGLRAAFDELEQQLCGPDSVYVATAAASGGGAGLPGSEPFAALGASWATPCTLRPFVRGAAGGAAAGCAAPRLTWQPGADSVYHASLCLDVLCYIPAAMPAAEAVAAVVRPAVRRQLRAAAAEAAAAGAAGGTPGSVPPLRALHFRPPGLCHHVTLLYPLAQTCIEADEEALLPRRTALHRLLGLPPDRPLLRVANALDWAGAGGGAAGLEAALAAGGVGGRPRLRDVHAELPPSPVGGSLHLVQGSYDYYHYMQDKFDDAGWGCAYRSLQTLCSWFARQGYATRAPPTHREIQAALVRIGDKPASFVGSRQWIGAIELGYVLDALLGVQHRVLSVPSGDDMPSLARQIAHHFDTQGTPIMVGGGVLAYTLLGVDFDERTGRCAFLILDPHYTGGEDLKKIHGGQWVAWKEPGDRAAAGGDLFVSTSFYNLLCPMRPATV